MFGGKNIRSEDGQTVVEFALVAPVLLAVLFAIIQFGIVFHQWVVLADAARAGARQASIVHTTTAGVAAARASGAGLDPAKLGVDVTPAFSDWRSGSDVSVTASYPYSINVLGLVVRSGSLQSTTTERVE